MNLLLANTFNTALGKLATDEQKAVKLTVFDFQQNPENPGHSFHRVERAKDKDFWSVRVNRDIRVIVHKRGSNLLVCYIHHHDKASAWAQDRRLENHPKTGVAQIAQIRETISEHLKTSSRKANWRPIQLSGISRQLPLSKSSAEPPPPTPAHSGAKQYADDDITPQEIEAVINQLDAYSAADLYESNKAIMKLVSDGFLLKREDFSWLGTILPCWLRQQGKMSDNNGQAGPNPLEKIHKKTR